MQFNDRLSAKLDHGLELKDEKFRYYRSWSENRRDNLSNRDNLPDSVVLFLRLVAVLFSESASSAGGSFIFIVGV